MLFKFFHLSPNAPFHFIFFVWLLKMNLAPWQFRHFPCKFLKSFMFYFLSYLFPVSPSLDCQDPVVSRSSCFLATLFDADFAGLISSSFISFWISLWAWEELFYQLYECLTLSCPPEYSDPRCWILRTSPSDSSWPTESGIGPHGWLVTSRAL